MGGGDEAGDAGPEFLGAGVELGGELGGVGMGWWIFVGDWWFFE